MPNEYTLVLPAQDTELVMKALGEIPLKVSKGAFDRIAAQVLAQQARAVSKPDDAGDAGKDS